MASNSSMAVLPPALRAPQALSTLPSSLTQSIPASYNPLLPSQGSVTLDVNFQYDLPNMDSNLVLIAIQGLKELLEVLNDLEAGRSPNYYSQQRVRGHAPDCLNFNLGSETLPQLLDHLQASQPTVKAYIDDKLR